jgi:hypothetical protein
VKATSVTVSSFCDGSITRPPRRMRSYTMDRLRCCGQRAFIEERQRQWLQNDAGVKWPGVAHDRRRNGVAVWSAAAASRPIVVPTAHLSVRAAVR